MLVAKLVITIIIAVAVQQVSVVLLPLLLLTATTARVFVRTAGCVTANATVVASAGLRVAAPVLPVL